MEISDAIKLTAIEEENRKLKRLVADLSLDNQVLKDLLEKTFDAQSQAKGDVYQSNFLLLAQQTVRL